VAYLATGTHKPAGDLKPGGV
jgi:hypothetical protein